MTGGKRPAILDTLAVALAATGDCNKAIVMVDQGFKLSKEFEVALTCKRLALFPKDQPYSDSSP